MSSRPRLPAPARIEAAAAELFRRGDVRTLICLVERWAQLGQPSASARLLQIQAFLQLGLMDRAWARLQELAAFGEAPLQRLKLTAYMFIERGWPQRAQEPLAEARELIPSGETDPELVALEQRARAPARRAPSFDPPPDQSLDDALDAALLFLSTGAFIRARRLLDTLQRRFPQNRQVLDLIWGLRGDYELHGATLAGLVERFSPAARAAANLHGTTGGTSEDPQEPFSAPVGALFRDAVTLTDDDPETDAEPTQATRLDALEPAGTRGDEDDLGEETQVLRVIEAGRGRTRERVTESPESPPELEEEDDALVVLTRRRDAPPTPRMIEPLPLPEPAQRRRRKRSTSAEQTEAPPSPPAAIRDDQITALPPEASGRHNRPAIPSWALAALMAVALSGASGAILLLWLALQAG